MNKLFKKITSIALSAIMTTALAVSVTAYDFNGEVFPETYSEITKVTKTNGEEIILYPGEILRGDRIIGEAIVSEAHSSAAKRLNSAGAKGNCPNYASSYEYIQLHYTGYIQFIAAYLTQSGDGNGLKPGRHVKQAWIDYQRKNRSVIGGTKYTSTAPNEHDTVKRSQTASCWDDILDWSEEATTYFCRGWIYFA